MSAKKYWFKPKRFWGWFAAYYPVSAGGWAVTIIAFAVLVWKFREVDSKSHSGSDTLLAFAPWFILVGLALDIIMRKTGEYPAWWKKWKK
jgi:hypothetical protein